MHQINELEHHLRAHRNACNEVLQIAEEEHANLQSGRNTDYQQTIQRRKNVLAQLGNSLEKMRTHRAKWLELDVQTRFRHPAILELLRQSQELIMRVMLFDREIEQLYLRRGMLPARAIPSHHRQKPNYVAGLYQRSAPGS